MEHILKNSSELDLLKLHSLILKELKDREVIRSKNNPLGDYTEWLVSNKLNLDLARKSSAGHDATDKNGVKYEIKSRRITIENKSRQLSVFRELKLKKFDFLIAVVFDSNFNIDEAYKIPHDVVFEYANLRKYLNGHLLHLKGKILKDIRVKDVKKILEN